MAGPQGLHLDQAVVLGHDRFADRQSESTALLVDALILLLQLSKAFEELFDVAAVDASARVKDVHNQTLGHFVIGHADLNETFLCELKGVLDQVDQDLLQSDLVSHEPGEEGSATRVCVLVQLHEQIFNFSLAPITLPFWRMQLFLDAEEELDSLQPSL